MAGECLSYGAFGAYNTEYSKVNKQYEDIYPQKYSVQKLKSWKNFLPDVWRNEHQGYYQPNDITSTSHGASKNLKDYDHEESSGLKDVNTEVTWVVKRYTPLDVRTYAPVPRHKYVLRHSSAPPPSHWIPPRLDSDPEATKFSAIRREKSFYSSVPYTRDERWSTLREMLPSDGRPIKIHPQNWGSDGTTAPLMTNEPQRRFPMVNSPMSRFVADMHLTNREFRLF